jgi:hypothetical protein
MRRRRGLGAPTTPRGRVATDATFARFTRSLACGQALLQALVGSQNQASHRGKPMELAGSFRKCQAQAREWKAHPHWREGPCRRCMPSRPPQHADSARMP